MGIYGPINLYMSATVEPLATRYRHLSEVESHTASPKPAPIYILYLYVWLCISSAFLQSHCLCSQHIFISFLYNCHCTLCSSVWIKTKTQTGYLCVGENDGWVDSAVALWGNMVDWWSACLSHGSSEVEVRTDWVECGGGWEDAALGLT